jgi:hypothetical protein
VLNKKGATTQAVATATFSNATSRDVTGSCGFWQSDNQGVATVSSEGVLTAQSSGSATISAMCQGMPARGGVTLNLALKATPTLVTSATVSISPDSPFLYRARFSNVREAGGACGINVNFLTTQILNSAGVKMDESRATTQMCSPGFGARITSGRDRREPSRKYSTTTAARPRLHAVHCVCHRRSGQHDDVLGHDQRVVDDSIWRGASSTRRAGSECLPVREITARGKTLASQRTGEAPAGKRAPGPTARVSARWGGATENTGSFRARSNAARDASPIERRQTPTG